MADAEYAVEPLSSDPTPTQWHEHLNTLFTRVSRDGWSDGRERPGSRSHDGAFTTYSRSTVPRNQWLDTLWSYYVGDPPLPKVAEDYRDLFRDVLRKARSNYAPMCISAMLDRMELQAVSTQSDDDTDGDDVADEIMEDSGFAASFKDLLGYLFSMGESYGMVVPPSAPGELPTIHAIDPRRCVGVRDRSNPIRLAAALVRDCDEVTNEQVSYLFLPGVKYEFRQENGSSTWNVNDAKTEDIAVPAELGGIPIVRFENPHGIGEYEPHIDLLDRINDSTLQRIIGFWYQALRQRAVGVDEDEEEDDFDPIEDGDDEGLVKRKPIDWDKVQYQAGPGSLWKFPKDFEIWESQQTDFGPFINAKRDDVKEFAAVTSTPLYLITPDDANGSALGAGLQREASTSKVRDRRARITPGLKLLWRIAFALKGDVARGRKMDFSWGPIEFLTLAEQGSASVQAQGTLSTEDRLERIWQMSPEDASRNMQRMRAEQLMAAAAAAVGGGPPVQQPNQNQQPPNDGSGSPPAEAVA